MTREEFASRGLVAPETVLVAAVMKLPAVACEMVSTSPATDAA